MGQENYLIGDHQPSNGMGNKERRWKLSSLSSILWLLFFICLSLVFLVDVFQSSYTLVPRILPPTYIDSSSNGFLIKTQGCRIPYMDPMDPSIKEFIFDEEEIVCNDGIPPLFDSNLTSIFLLESSLEHYAKDVVHLNCCYRAFYRDIPKPDQSDNKYTVDEKCFLINGTSAVIFEEFIIVECLVKNETVYTDYFSFVPNRHQERKKFDRKPLNILVVGIDAVSRLNFHRQMPRTLALLQNLSAIEMFGYNKVADNTFPNLIPVLTGLSEDELTQTCWKENEHFDRCHYLWDDFKAKGYTTLFGEDSAWMGIFNYVKRGFQRQPTDYSWSFFNRIAEDKIGNAHRMNVMRCVGGRKVYQTFLKYIKTFLQKMSLDELPFFAFNWGASLSHDYLNTPKLGDPDYHEFFRSLNETGVLRDTVVILMSDHGIRWGDIRQTYHGRMEERLPFLFFLFPDWYKLEFPEAYTNLVKNVLRLTTPFDLHETLKDLLTPYQLKHEFLQGKVNASARGISLFNEIPLTRTCASANISEHFCTCQQSVETDKNDSIVIAAAAYAVAHINSQLEGYAQCANLSLSAITDARVMTHSEQVLGDVPDRKDYMLNLVTVPGEAIFEVTLRNTYNVTYPFEVMGTISRLNLYGKQSACITDFHLKLYCFCKGLLDST